MIPLQILYLSSVSWKIIPLYFFSSNNIYFSQKELIKMKFLRLSSGRVKFCQIPYANFERTSRFLYKFVSLFSFMKANSSILFLAQKIYTLLEGSPLKWKFVRLSSAGSSFLKFLMPILEQRVDSSTNLYPFSVPSKLTPLYIF